MFDPAIGRWQSKDPKSFDAGDTNLYRYVGNHPSYATDPSGLEELDKGIDWDASPLFNDVKRSVRVRLNQLRRVYQLAITEGRSAEAADILDAARSHASLNSSNGFHPDHDKFLQQDASVRRATNNLLGQSVVMTSDGLEFVGNQLHEGFEFAVDVKMILSGDATVEGDQLIEIAPGIFERNRYISPRETPSDDRLLAKLTLQAEVDITLALMTGGGSFRPGYGQLDDTWGYERLILKSASTGIGAVDNVITSRLGTYSDEVRSAVSSQSGGLGRRFRRGGGNIAVSELQTGDDIVHIPAFSGTDDLAGFAPYTRNSDRVLGAGGVRQGAGNFLRDVDAEAKILERMLSLTTAETRGALRLYSELPFCDSCQAVIANFHKYRPSLTLELVTKDGSRLISPRLP